MNAKKKIIGILLRHAKQKKMFLHKKPESDNNRIISQRKQY